MTVTIRKIRGSQKILGKPIIDGAEMNNSDINIRQGAGGLNIFAADDTLLIQGDSDGLTVQDSDGTRRSRLGVQPDGTRDVFFGLTAEGEDIE